MKISFRGMSTAPCLKKNDDKFKGLLEISQLDRAITVS